MSSTSSGDNLNLTSSLGHENTSPTSKSSAPTSNSSAPTIGHLHFGAGIEVAYETLDASGNVFSRMKEWVLEASGKYVVTEIDTKNQEDETKTERVAINVNSLVNNLGIKEDQLKDLEKDRIKRIYAEATSLYNEHSNLEKNEFKKVVKEIAFSIINEGKIEKNGNEITFKTYVGGGAYGTVYKVKKFALEQFKSEVFAEKHSKLRSFDSTPIKDLINEFNILKKIEKWADENKNQEVLNGIQEAPWRFQYKGENETYVGQFEPSESDFELLSKIGVMRSRYYSKKTMKDNINKMGAGEKIKAMDPLLKGLAFIQGKKILHIDIKPENIFVDTIGGKKVFRLGDFGGARLEDEKKEYGNIPHSPKYTPYTDEDNPKSRETEDLERIGAFQMGVTLYHALSGGKFPYKHKVIGDFPQEREYLVPEAGTFDREQLKGYPEDVIKFIELLCDPDPTKRPTGDAIRQKWEAIVDNHGGIEKLAEEADRGTKRGWIF